MIFVKVKNFVKFHFGNIYPIVRKILLGSYMKIRTLYLGRFKKKVLYNFYYSDICFKIFLDPKNGFIDKEIFWKGVYEEEFLDFLKKELKNTDVYIDIGANIGQHALFASCLVNKGYVYAFEPNFPVYNQLVESIEINPNIKNISVYNIGLGSEKKTEKFYVNTENIGGSSLLEYKNTMNAVTIEIDKGDTFLLGLEKVNFIKIDVEGFEYETLLGLQETIKKFKPKMLIEFTPIFYNKKEKGDAYKIINFLFEHGYSFVDLESIDIKKIYTKKDDMLNWVEDLNKDQTNIFCYLL